MLARSIETHARGGITTIHWPVENFVICEGKDCDDNSNDTDVDPVEFIVNNYVAFDNECSGDKFDEWVDGLATFLKKLKQRETPIPVIQRPFHEMNGSGGLNAHWWAGKTTVQFRTMWQRLVDRLRYTHDATRSFAKATGRGVPRLVAITEVGRKDGTSDPSTGKGFLNFWMKGVKPALDARLAQHPEGQLTSRQEAAERGAGGVST